MLQVVDKLYKKIWQNLMGNGNAGDYVMSFILVVMHVS